MRTIKEIESRMRNTGNNREYEILEWVLEHPENDERGTVPRFCPYCGSSQVKYVDQPNVFGDIVTGVLCLKCKARAFIDHMYGDMCFSCGRNFEDEEALMELDQTNNGRPICPDCGEVMEHVDYL